MNDERPEQLDERVLVLAPTARDAATSRDLLEAAGIHCFICDTIENVCREAGRGAGAAVVTAEAVLGDEERRVAAWLQTQPPWSDFPLVVLTPPGPESANRFRALEAIGHMTLIQRPVQVSILISTVRSALRDRRRQSAVRNLLDERQRAAEILREERERYRVTLTSIGDAVIATDEGGKVTFLNQVAEQLTGWNMETARGHPLQEVFRIVDEETREPVPSPALRALEEGVVAGLSNHTILIAKDGTERPLDDSAAPIRSLQGNVVGTVLVFRDLTEKKRAKRALRDQEERAEAALARDALLLANVHDAIVVTDLDGIVTYWNEGATRLFGWTAEEIVGRHYADRFPESVRPWIREEIRSRAEGTTWTGEFEDYRKDGSRVWIDSRVTHVTDAAGRVVGILGLSHDITERKKAEDALKEVDRRKDDFIALLAHELRNPLAPLRNGLQVMRLGGKDAGSVAEARAMMERQLGHMVRLIDDLLDVSRISRNKMELRRSRVLLADVVGNAVEAARPLIDAAGHELTVSLPAEPIFLDADLTRLAQVFNNLLTNSAKYTEHRGHICLTAERRDEDVFVSVRDNGIGIPRDALPSVFDMFSQVDRSIERSAGGLGIGLALVKGLVEMHGGTVTVQSEGEGKGSTFTVELPVLESGRRQFTISTPDKSQALRGPKRRMLVVDDNRDSAESMAMMLKLLGNDVRVAHDGIEAIEAADAFHPQVILMDVGMPRLNGLDATRRIREQPWGRPTIVALTGWGQEGDKVRSQEAGCDGHLVKPVSLLDLQRFLADARASE
jgi:PAS domain S-box-containing protein